MLVPAIIRTLGDARDFEYTDLKGNKKTTTAIDVQLKSGSDEFTCSAFDNVATRLATASCGTVVLADLHFSRRERKREDGSAYAVQAVTISEVDFVGLSTL